MATMTDLGEGAYLTFDPASQGTMFLQWSKEHVNGALAFIRPGKPVPTFKFKQNGGKSELIRNMQQDHTKYYHGWCSFVKVGKQYDGTYFLLSSGAPPRPIQVVFNVKNSLISVEADREYHLGDVDAVSVVPRDNTDFIANTNMALSLFTTRGNSAGAVHVF
eukprot:GHVT01078327.1.p1 GENE.GHVT01078327.1~~GHVT01078327.1.p1  ORF type:complete len:162 (+),score=6.26 GHVT01078327.1:2039-2524(+)